MSENKTYPFNGNRIISFFLPRTEWILIRYLLLNFLFFSFLIPTVAQVSNYSYSTGTGTYTQLTGGGITVTNTVTGGNTDDGYILINLPFTFTYNGNNYTQVTAGTNGWLAMGNSTATSWTANDLFNTNQPQNAIAAWWGDGNLNAGTNGGNFRHGTTGTDIYTVQYDQFSGSANGNTSGANKIRFQISLFGPSSTSPGRIEILYGTTNGTISTGRSIGIKSVTGTASWINGTNGSTVSTATAGAFPSNGTRYIFTPPPPVTINTVHPAAGTIDQNSTANMIAAYELITGSTARTPSSFSFTTAGTYTAVTDISTFSLYSNSSNSLSGATLIGNITAAGNPQTLTFNSGFSALAANSTTYFIITANVPLTARDGNTVNIAQNTLANFAFTAPTTRLGTNPAPAGNTQTILGPRVTITATHPAAGTINQNSTDNIIAAYQMDIANGDITPATFTFVTAGTYANTTDISNLKLYQNTTNDLTGATLLQTIPGATRPQTLVFNTGFSTLSSGSTVYFLVTADVPLTATNGNTINITSNSLNNFSFTGSGGAGVGKSGTNPVDAGNTQTITAPVVNITAVHPAAGILLQNTTDNILASYRMITANGNLTPVSFTFTTAGTYIPTTDITTFRLYSNNGNNLATATLIGTITASGNPQTLTFNSGFTELPAGSTTFFLITADVPLTALNNDNIRIQANNLSNFTFTNPSGGAFTVTGTNPATIGNLQTIYGPTVAISTAHNAAGNITQGTTDNIIAVYQFDVLNAVAVAPSSVTLTTAGSYTNTDIVIFKMYQNSAATLSGATLAGTVAAPASGGNITFNSGFTGVPSAGTGYLIVTADVSPTAVLGRQVRLTSTSFSNFTFIAPGGKAVQETGTNPAVQSNLQTIVDPQVAVSVTHPIPGSIKVGTQNNLVASFRLVTANCTITPTGVTLTTGGTFQGATAITSFNLYQNTANSLTGATLVGTVNISGTSPTNTLVFNSGFTAIAPATTNYLLLVADVSGNPAVVGQTVTITTTPLSNFTFTSSAAVTVTGTNPLAAPTAPGQTIVLKLDVYWSNTISPKTWNITNVNWGQNAGGGPTTPLYQNNVWITTGIGQLEGTAGQVSVAAQVSARQLLSTLNNYRIDASSSTNGITFTSPAEFNVSTGTTYVGGNTNTNPVIYGINGLTKTGLGELQIGSPVGTGFNGALLVNAGELTLGRKSSTTASPYQYLKGNTLELDNAKFTIAAYGGAGGSLQQLTSVVSTGNSTISLYQTNPSYWMNIIPSTNNAAAVAGTYVPLQVSGQLTVNTGGSTNLTGIFDQFGNPFYQNMIAFGTTTLTGNTTLVSYSNNADVGNGLGNMININLGGYGHYLTGVSLATGSMNDNGYTLTALGGGNASSDGGEINLNASSSTMTGDWVIGDAAGTNAAWFVTNTSTCLTRGTVTIYNYSKFCPQITSTANVNITYSPDTMYVYGLGPANQGFPSALDFFNFSGTSAGVTSIPSHIVLKPVYNSNLASIGSQVGGTSTNVTFILNGTISGTGGLEKTGPGIIQLNTQNISGNYNTYQDSTRIRNGTLTINAGSNMGTGPLVMHQLSGRPTTLNLNNTAQTVSSIATVWTNTSGTYAQTINLASGHTFTVNQDVNTTFGNYNTSTTLTGVIAGAGNLIKSGTGTLTLTGPNTYTGLTQVKGGVLQLNRSGGTTLPVTNNIDVIGGTLRVSSNQTLNNVTLSTGVLQVDNGVTLTINGTLTIVPNPTSGAVNFVGTGRIIFGNSAILNYAGNTVQNTSIKEIPVSNGPRNIAFSNYSSEGVILTAGIAVPVATSATVFGWLDFNGQQITGTGSFTLNGGNTRTPRGSTSAGSNIITNVTSLFGLSIGMAVSSTELPPNTYIIYIDPLVPNSITLNNNAIATATISNLTIVTRGGLKVNRPGGITEHVAVTGTKTYNPDANYIFNVPVSGNQIYPAFPTTGVLNFSPAHDLTIQSGISNRVIMGTSQSLEISNNLTLTSGILVTNDNLITWSNSGGSLTGPANSIPWTEGPGNAYNESYIATSLADGSPLTLTIPFNGAKGFRIKNVGNTDVYFPVGADFTSANRMMINNTTTTDDFTVVVGKGDLTNTPKPRVNRIWYVKATNGTGIQANMKLFFTKRSWSAYPFPYVQDEVETGFLYSDPHLVQKDYNNLFFNNSLAPGDVPDFTSKPDNIEIYGQYTFGLSPDINNETNGITGFTRFSIVNAADIILPVTIINLSASRQQGGIEVKWTALNELDVQDYEVQKSADGINFASIETVAAKNNGQPVLTYAITDAKPFTGNNYYRIKAISKNGEIQYTAVVVINITGIVPAVKVYPNPVIDKTINVQMSNMPAGKYELAVHSISGQQVYRSTINFSGGTGSQQVALPSAIAGGMYTLRLTREDTVFTIKLMIR